MSFEVQKGEVFGIVGESGSGKTTLAKMLLRILSPDEGAIYLWGRDLFALGGKGIKNFRSKVQAITQNCENALNPRMRIRESLKEVFLVKGKRFFRLVRDNELINMLIKVGLQKEHLDRFPAQLSGGQLQRVIVARVMALQPELIIADEPIANLDVSVQAQIIHLILNLKKSGNFTLIFISHDLELAAAISDRIAVMLNGEIVEIGAAKSIMKNPEHNYTKRLVELAKRGTK